MGRQIIFETGKYETLSDPSPPVIKLSEWGPWVVCVIVLDSLFKIITWQIKAELRNL